MELRAYWAVIKRRFWVIVPIIVVVALYTAYQYYHLYRTSGALTAYQSTVTIRVGLQANPHNSDQNYADYLSVSETLADTIVTAPVITSRAFTTDVSQQIQIDTDQITQRYGLHPDLGDWQNPQSISAALSASRVHTLVTVTVNWSSPAGAWAIAHAIGEISASHLGTYLDYEIRSASPLSSAPNAHPVVSAQVINPASEPVQVAGSSSNKPELLLALLLVACIMAIALAFLVEYLDDHIHSREEAELLLQLPCIGEIPPTPASDKNVPHAASASCPNSFG